MDSEEIMILRDLPVKTRNYVIIDNITGKPIEQSSYSLTIDQEVINKLNKLKRVNEEKLKQASLRDQYSEATLVDTFTPEDTSVFTPVYEGEYIDYRDYVEEAPPAEEEHIEEVEQVEEATFTPTEVLQSDTLLERVKPREKTEEQPESQEMVEQEPQKDYISIDQQEAYVPKDNSTFNPNDTGLAQASKQIVNIDTEKLGPEIKTKRHARKESHKISLDKVEIREGKSIGWLAYILFFIPLLFKRNNRFVRMHANEGLELNIMELVGVLLIVPYFVVTQTSDTVQMVITVCALLGLVLLTACVLSILPMIIVALFGKTFQIPWLWKKRIIKVNATR